MIDSLTPSNHILIFRTSSADVVIFANSPLGDIIKEIASKYSIRLIEYNLDQQPQYMRSYHASTLRWPFIYNFFKVIICLSVLFNSKIISLFCAG